MQLVPRPLPTLQRILERHGLCIRRYPLAGTLNFDLQRVIRALGIDCVIDVGANRGQFASHLRTVVGYRGRIASVEPADAALDALRLHSSDDLNWAVYPYALSNRSATRELCIYESDDFNSFHQANELGRTRFGLSATGYRTLETRRLADQWDELTAGSENVLLKTDTQGHDLEVLEGAGDRPIKALLLELSVQLIYQGTHTLPEVLTTLEAKGYAPVGLYPISRSADRLRLIEVDGLFVRGLPDEPSS
jgi:FkbM family methyltransferase